MIKEKINSETGEVRAEYPEEINEHDAATIVFATEPVMAYKIKRPQDVFFEYR